ncbi:hypothetical protein WEH80_16700 [Actinomycetes bacterium KLBMP 9759]
MTCLSDGRAHDVPDVEFTRGSGHYQAICGHTVYAAPMVEPDGKPCQLCTEMWELNHDQQRVGRFGRLSS